jgi:hypothetical protein
MKKVAVAGFSATRRISTRAHDGCVLLTSDLDANLKRFATLFFKNITSHSSIA